LGTDQLTPAHRYPAPFPAKKIRAPPAAAIACGAFGVADDHARAHELDSRRLARIRSDAGLASESSRLEGWAI